MFFPKWLTIDYVTGNDSYVEHILSLSFNFKYIRTNMKWCWSESFRIYEGLLYSSRPHAQPVASWKLDIAFLYLVLYGIYYLCLLPKAYNIVIPHSPSGHAMYNKYILYYTHGIRGMFDYVIKLGRCKNSEIKTSIIFSKIYLHNIRVVLNFTVRYIAYRHSHYYSYVIIVIIIPIIMINLYIL